MNRTNEQTTVADAEAAISRLEQKRSELLARADELASNRGSVAYKALSEDDAAARATLDRITKQSIEHGSELASIDAALVTAKQKLEVAKQHQAAQRDRDNARELSVVLDQFTQTAAELDRVLADVARLGHTLHQIQAKMYSLGSPVPNGAQLDSLGFRCLLTACAATPWHRHFQVLAPHERRSFSDLIAIWTDTNRKHLASRLGDPTNEAA
jgi:chromosome segregation ATPase